MKKWFFKWWTKGVTFVLIFTILLQYLHEMFKHTLISGGLALDWGSVCLQEWKEHLEQMRQSFS